MYVGVYGGGEVRVSLSSSPNVPVGMFGAIADISIVLVAATGGGGSVRSS